MSRQSGHVREDLSSSISFRRISALEGSDEEEEDEDIVSSWSDFELEERKWLNERLEFWFLRSEDVTN